MTQLRSVTCHMRSHSVTCYPTQVNTSRLNPSHTGRYSIYLPRRDGRLSWPSWLDSARAGSRTSDLSITSQRPTTAPPSIVACMDKTIYVIPLYSGEHDRRTEGRHCKHTQRAHTTEAYIENERWCVCRLHRGSNCVVISAGPALITTQLDPRCSRQTHHRSSAATDGRVLRYGTVGSCHSAANSEIVNYCFWWRVWLAFGETTQIFFTSGD